MSPEGQVMYDALGDEMLEFQEFLRTNLPLPPNPTFEFWVERTETIAQMVERYLHVLGTHREFRRAYGHEVEEATLNRMDLALDQCGQAFPSLIRLLAGAFQVTR